MRLTVNHDGKKMHNAARLQLPEIFCKIIGFAVKIKKGKVIYFVIYGRGFETSM